MILRPRLGALLLGLAALGPLAAAPTPHPTRPDRLVETRGELSVEYSPGQEAWMEMAFTRLQAEPPPPADAASARAAAPLASGPAAPGSARDLRTHRADLLAALARQTGLPHATDLQGRVFDTFLGYYEVLTEMVQNLGHDLPDTFTVRRLAIWQRDDLLGRLRAGARIEGMSYDAATDSGRFEMKLGLDSPAIAARIKALYATIEAQQLKHRLEYGQGTISASFTLGAPATPAAAPAAPTPAAPAAPDPTADLVIPVIYRGDVATPPKPEDFTFLPRNLRDTKAALVRQAANYRDPNLVGLILHEAAEAGLVGQIIASRDRRWLCDGSANYAAWRVARDRWGQPFADQAYSLDRQLADAAAEQPRVSLAAWPAVEHEPHPDPNLALTRAHYAFATRAVFLLAVRHGEDAPALLWADVARTPKAKVSAKTFAAAYRKRYKGDLAKLIRDAEQLPLPAAKSAPAARP